MSSDIDVEDERAAGPVARNTKRREPSIEFGEDGCVAGWAYLVREAFRPALDIVFTRRKKAELWTEGDPPAYGFRAADCLPSRAVVAGTEHLNCRLLVVIDAEPDSLAAGAVVAGWVMFRLLEWDGAAYVERCVRRVSQREFAAIAASGEL